ncbi:MAG: hypothetical protein R3B06_11960 [Kofleriaceae bacterium]
MHRPVFVAALAAAACHSSIRYQDTRIGEARTRVAEDRARALPPTATLDLDGTLRLVAPLVCPSVIATDVASFDVDVVRPNAAAVVVGVILAGVGVVAGASGLSAAAPGSSPLTYLGGGGVAVGIPVVIGSLVGGRTVRTPTGTQVVERAGPEARCGERPVAARHAVVLWSGLHVESGVDPAGRIAVSPFDVIDAFEARVPSLDLAVDADADAGRLRLDVVIDASHVAAARPGFLAARGVDATVPPLAQLGKLAQYEPGPLAVSLADGPALRVSLPLTNVGPGPGYGVRMALASSSPEVDGRIAYAGVVAPGATATMTVTIALSAEAARAVAGPDFTLAALVKDGHGLGPSTPVRLRSAVLRAPR